MAKGEKQQVIFTSSEIQGTEILCKTSVSWRTPHRQTASHNVNLLSHFKKRGMHCICWWFFLCPHHVSKLYFLFDFVYLTMCKLVDSWWLLPLLKLFNKNLLCIVTYTGHHWIAFWLQSLPLRVISPVVSKLSLFFHHHFEVWIAKPATDLVPDTYDQCCLQRTSDPFIQCFLFIYAVITQPSLTGLTQP